MRLIKLLCMPFALAVLGAAVLIPGAAEAKTPAAVASQSHPAPPRTPPPSGAGCFRYTPATGWHRLACDSPQYIAEHIPHPQVLAGVGESAGFAHPFRGTTVRVSFPFGTIGPESDSRFGANAYSIQDNAFFKGTSGHLDAVQFTDQATPDGLLEAWYGQTFVHNVCVWQVDITTKTYTPNCFTFDYPYIGAVQGVTFNQGYIDTLVAYKGSWVGVGAPDLYGLESGTNWNNASGTILGYGDGSQAVFAGTEAETEIDGTTCLNEDAFPIWPTKITCTSAEKVKGHSYTGYSPGPMSLGAYTVESNNLIPVIGSPPGVLPGLTHPHSAWNAATTYTATTSGKCWTGTMPLCT